ncbi:hypothetical protein FCU94_12920 [Vibrio sp. JPW-9-11-11]|uniref:DUF6279 family lipoprotein n=1 Tax=Vibrio sp. JPW-9-11-11 TaxID=1416532 RepID=UPI001593DC5B|nr:DUF6279 family lipoprotein [Vibrio sp. JPW-9-11-11]NVD07785.1 hypothetical protein [Vibrio sp. JPW-9-11-11]
MKKWSLILLLVVLGGCSTSFVYDNIDWLAVEFVEDYVELEDSQEQLISNRVELLGLWHRQQELPNYVAYLDELLVIEPSGFTPEDIQYHENKLRTFTERLAERVAPDIAVLASKLNDDQVEEFMNSLRVRHTKYKERYQALSDSDIKQRYRERIEKNLQRWLGHLSQAQQQALSAWVDEMRITSRDWISHQTTMRVKIKSLLAQRANVEVFNPRLNALLLSPESYYSAELAQKIEHNREVSRVRLIEIIHLMSEKQTQHFRDEVKDWQQLAEDIQ